MSYYLITKINKIIIIQKQEEKCKEREYHEK